MKTSKALYAALLAAFFGFGASVLPMNMGGSLFTTPAIAEDDEDPFANLMETTFVSVDKVDFAAPAAGAAAKVTATLSLLDEEEISKIDTVKLVYSVNGGDAASVDMTGDGKTYTAEIPGQAAGAKVEFYIQAMDALKNVTTGAFSSSTKFVEGVADMDNSPDLVPDDTDILGISANYDKDYIYVNFDVQGKVNGGSIEPPNIVLYGIKITDPQVDTTEGLMVGKLWAYLPLATDKAVQEKFLPMLTQAGGEVLNQVDPDGSRLKKVMETGMLVLDIQKLMGGDIPSGLLFSADPEAKVDGNKFMGKIKRAAFADAKSLRFIILTASNGSIDSLMPTPLNCSNFLTLDMTNYSYTVQ